MIDINATDFREKFDIKKATIGIVGYGYVGKAVAEFFRHAPSHPTIFVHDKAKPELHKLEEVVKYSEVIFICVPTPMKNDGGCYTGIVEDVIKSIRDEAIRQNRNLDSFVMIIKSTVKAGFTEEMQDKYFGIRLLFSPEFLTEKNSVADFINTNRIIFGGDEEDAAVASTYFYACIPERVENDSTLLLQCHPTVAEMVKLYTNGILMTKILFSNEIFLMCEKLGIAYDEVRTLSVLDSRIGSSHTSVPGHDGQLGAGGHCFPKDINNLKALAKELGVDEKIFTSVIERNNQVREDKDWLRMQGRAVIDV